MYLYLKVKLATKKGINAIKNNKKINIGIFEMGFIIKNKRKNIGIIRYPFSII